VIPALVVFLYLGIVFYIGIFAFRRRGSTKGGAEEFFLAGRSLGGFVFLLSLFGTNMTAFTILGASGHAFLNGIVTFPLMASSSALIIPLSLFLIGTRVWALGKRYGFITPVQMFRDRWECGHIGTVITVVQSALLVPYIIISVMGGGTALSAVSGGLVPYWLGGAVVALVVMSYVFFGGMRGTAWVNTFQTLLFLSFGALIILIVGRGIGGFGAAAESLAASPLYRHLLTRERFSPWVYFSYTLIPLSSIAFPHILIFCLTAKRMEQFKKTVIVYPLCIAAVWLPSVFLGVMANHMHDVPEIQAKLEARQQLAIAPTAETRAKSRGDDVLLLVLGHYAPAWLAGVLGAGIMAAVMASDSQILALSTMFTEDIFAYYGGRQRFGESAQVQTGRAFVVAVTVVAYGIALQRPEQIFDLAVQYAFTGYAALAPLLVAALFWKGSTKWGSLAAVVWTALAIASLAFWPAKGGPPLFFGMLPVVPITLGSVALLTVVSLLTPKPSADTLARYFHT
jgi:solute:Na+ symporter, SSS family